VGPTSLNKRENKKGVNGADAPAHRNGIAADAVDVDAAHAAYNEAARMHGFEQCRVLTMSRRKRLMARLVDIGGLAAFERALSAIPQDNFLMGCVTPKPGQAPFKLNIIRLLQTEGGLGDVLANLLDRADGSATPTQNREDYWVTQQMQSPDGQERIRSIGNKAAEQFLRQLYQQERGPRQ
jgi:hypothetical protein